MASPLASTVQDNLYTIDPNGDLIIDLIRPEDEEWDTDEEHEEDGFDEYDPDGDYFAATGSIMRVDPGYDDDMDTDEEEEYEPTPRTYRPVPRVQSAHEGRNADREPHDNPSEEDQKLLRASFRVSSKCLSLASGYFKGIFRHPPNTWSEAQQGRFEIPAPWGFKVFKILMHIAHLQFIKIPDQLGINTMVKLVIAADYLMMLPALNPWLFRWAFEAPFPWNGRPYHRPDRSLKHDMQWLYVSLHLGYAGVFREMFEQLVERHGDITHAFKTFGLPIPQTIIDSLVQYREQKISNLLSSLQKIIDVYVTDDGNPLDDNSDKFCSPQCKNRGFSHLMIHLHRLNIYPNIPQPPYDKWAYDELARLIDSTMKTANFEDGVGCRAAKVDNAPTCSIEWAFLILEDGRDMERSRGMARKRKFGDLLPGWQNRQLKTWVMYRKGEYFDTDGWIRERHGTGFR